MRIQCLWTIGNIFWPIFTIYIYNQGLRPFLSSELCTKVWNESKWEQRRSAVKRKGNIKEQTVENNSPYLKSVCKCWVSEEISLLFYSTHFKWHLASHAFLLLFVTMWNTSIKSGKGFYKTGNKTSASGLQENWNTSKFLK